MGPGPADPCEGERGAPFPHYARNRSLALLILWLSDGLPSIALGCRVWGSAMKFSLKKFIPSLKLSQKLPLALVGSAIVVGAGVGIASYIIASSALEHQARQQLDTIAFERANQLGVYLRDVETDLVKTSGTETVQQAVANLATAYAGMTNK